jgi:hypothetical protein
MSVVGVVVSVYVLLAVGMIPVGAAVDWARHKL